MNKILFIALLLCSSVVTFAQNDSVKAIVPEQADAAKSVAPATTDSVAKAPKAKKEKKTKTAHTGKSLKVNKELDLKALQGALANVIHNHQRDLPVAQDTLPMMLSEQYAKYPEVQTAIAQAYIQNSLPEKALIYFRKAGAGLGGDYAPALVAEAEMVQHNNDLDSAAVLYERAIKADPEFEESYSKYSLMYADLANSQASGSEKEKEYIAKGEEVIDRLRKNAPQVDADKYLADFYGKAQMESKSADVYYRLFQEGKLDERRTAETAAQCYLSNRQARGYEVASAGAKKWPNNMDMKRQILWNAPFMGKYEEAYNAGKEYLSSIPTDSIDKAKAYDYRSLSLSCFSLKKYDEGIDYFKKIEELQKNKDASSIANYVLQFRGRDVNTVAEQFEKSKDWNSSIELRNKYITYSVDEQKVKASYDLCYMYYMMLMKDSTTVSQNLDTFEKITNHYASEYSKSKDCCSVLFMQFGIVWNINPERCLDTAMKLSDLYSIKSPKSDDDYNYECQVNISLGAYWYQERNDLKNAKKYWQRVVDSEGTSDSVFALIGRAQGYLDDYINKKKK